MSELCLKSTPCEEVLWLGSSYVLSPEGEQVLAAKKQFGMKSTTVLQGVHSKKVMLPVKWIALLQGASCGNQMA